MKRRVACGMVALVAVMTPVGGGAQTVLEVSPTSPTLTVSGRGEVSTAPDRATLRLGAVAQAEQAAAAQTEVSKIVQEALGAIRALGVPEERIQTSGLNLSAVYSQYDPQTQAQVHEPRITGYRASNTIQVQLDDLAKIGSVLDAGVAAGANQIEGVSFELRNDNEQRKLALKKAVEEARGKAEAISAAAGVRLESLKEISEGGVDIIRPMVHGRMAGVAMAAEAAPGGAPVQPGEVQIQATVTVQYVIAGTEGAVR